MKALYDQVSIGISKLITQRYSTSFSLGILFLNKKYHNAIYSIYGFVRIADEIVDSFENYPQADMLNKFRKETSQSIQDKISTNPVLNAFQEVVHLYNIEDWMINTFLNSMEMDLEQKEYSRLEYENYILGSAEVVGLMCLKVFTDGDQKEYERLKPMAMKLGSAFQKINFLRDLNQDYNALGRSYFPGVDLDRFNDETKLRVEKEIEEDFRAGLDGIKKLPNSSKLGVYVAYVYYYALFRKIKKTSSNLIMKKRIRIRNERKMVLLVKSYLKYNLNFV